MEAVFLKLVNLSIAAGWLVLAVVVLRWMFRKAPRWIFCILWALVALRLVCPISVESALSLIPSAQTLPPEILHTATPQINSGISAINSAVNPVLSQSMAPAPGDSVNPTQVWTFLLSCIWIVGMAAMALYALVSYGRIKRRVGTATLLRDNIRQSEYVDSPFVLGLFRPVIYLPYQVESGDLEYVIAHERAHIRRKDHWWKPLGFLLLCVYWFNPLLWIAYVLLCRDIEGACDEKVIREMGLEDRRGYSTALLNCSVRRRSIAACPLAFGEVGVKERVKSVMHYKRPAFWLVAAALAACAAAAVCFLTNPPTSREFSMNGTDIADLNPQEIVEQIAKLEKLEDASHLYVNGDNFELNLTHDFQWEDSGTVRFFYLRDQQTYSAQLRIFPDEGKYFVTEATVWPEQDSYFMLQTYLEALKYLPQEVIRDRIPDAEGYCVYQVEDGTPVSEVPAWTYTADGLGAIDGWYIHLAVVPNFGGNEATPAKEALHFFYGGASAAPEVTQWFDYTGNPSELDWDEELTTQVPQFPGVTFRATLEQITAQGQKLGGRAIPLASGMPIWNAYFCDLTGDGLPELCATFSWGSGIVDTRVRVYDYQAGAGYTMESRGKYDYALRCNDADGLLYVDVKPYGEDTVVASGRLAFRDGCLQILDSALEWEEGAQITALPEEYDFDHDGVPERVELATYFDESLHYELRVIKADETILWRDTAYTIPMGYNSVFACRLEDGDYLLQYHPIIDQRYGSYYYELFSLDEKGSPVLLRENRVEFDIIEEPTLHESFDGEAIADFMDELNGLLAQSKLLVTTDTALEGIDPDHPQDNLWWLQSEMYCGGYLYDESLSLRENLLAFERFIEE